VHIRRLRKAIAARATAGSDPHRALGGFALEPVYASVVLRPVVTGESGRSTAPKSVDGVMRTWMKGTQTSP
jgi:hypothetical protein